MKKCIFLAESTESEICMWEIKEILKLKQDDKIKIRLIPDFRRQLLIFLWIIDIILNKPEPIEIPVFHSSNNQGSRNEMLITLD